MSTYKKQKFFIPVKETVGEWIIASLFIKAVEHEHDLEYFISHFMFSKTCQHYWNFGTLHNTHKQTEEIYNVYFEECHKRNIILIPASTLQLKCKYTFLDIAGWIGHFYARWHNITGEPADLIYYKAPFPIVSMHYFSGRTERSSCRIKRLDGYSDPYHPYNRPEPKISARYKKQKSGIIPVPVLKINIDGKIETVLDK